jgi:hypothetical protein
VKRPPKKPVRPVREGPWAGIGVFFKSSDESGLEIQFHKYRSPHSCKASSASLKKIRNAEFIPPGPSGEMPPSTAAKMAAAALRHHGKDIPV